MNRGLTLLAVVALLGSCGGGGGGGGPTRPTGPAPPADVAAMRALLERHAPESYAIVTALEALPRSWVFSDGGKVSLTTSAAFERYIDDGDPAYAVSHLETAVHECFHGYASVMGVQLQVEADLRGVDVQAVLVDGAPIAVTRTVTFPAREMTATYPADAHTSRYPLYVAESEDVQSTQSQGVYGLLDELTAYYHGARTVLALWPWVRDEAPADPRVLEKYAQRLHEAAVPQAEFTLFVLHYLQHARDHHPDVHAAVLGNDGFRRAFAAVDDAYAALVAEILALEPEVHAVARARGVELALVDGQLDLGGARFTVRDAASRRALAYLEAPAYAALRAALHGPAAPAPTRSR